MREKILQKISLQNNEEEKEKKEKGVVMNEVNETNEHMRLYLFLRRKSITWNAIGCVEIETCNIKCSQILMVGEILVKTKISCVDMIRSIRKRE
jgi:hypothetical protein